MAARLQEQELLVNRKYGLLPPHRIVTQPNPNPNPNPTVNQPSTSAPEKPNNTAVSNAIDDSAGNISINIEKISLAEKVVEVALEKKSEAPSKVDAIPVHSKQSTASTPATQVAPTSTYASADSMSSKSFAFGSSEGIDLTYLVPKSVSGIISEVRGNSGILTTKHILQLESVR